MGTFLLIVGILLALLGVGNFIGTMSMTGAGEEGIQLFSLIVNGALFVFPGLVLMGIGQMLRNRTSSGIQTPTPIAPRATRDGAFCTNCGAATPAGATKFCGNCGSAL